MKIARFVSMCFGAALGLGVPVHVHAVTFTVTKVVDNNTPIPEGAGDFACLSGFSVSGTNVAFWGSSFQPPFFCRPSGIYHLDGDTLSKVADTNTPIPGGSGNFTEFASPPLISGDNVAFGTFDQKGIYLFQGSTLGVVADTKTLAPGGTDTFVGFFEFAMSGNHVAFIGSSAGRAGVYLFNGTTLSKVADFDTPVPPGGADTFGGFTSLAINGHSIAFDGFGSGFGEEGIYLFDGLSLRAVADTNTPFPGGTGNFVGFLSNLPVSGNKLAFRGLGSGFQQGIYLFDGATLRTVADTNTPVPGGTGIFDDFGFTLLFDGSNVVFFGMSGQKKGIYLFDGTSLTAIADMNTLVPRGAGTFTAFADAAGLNDGHVVFEGRDSAGNGGIYFFNGATLSAVADITTPVPGKTGTFTGLGSSSLVTSDNNVAFAAGGAGQPGIYLATPDPISPATVWVGLKTSDDIGLRVDLRAEVFENDTLVASGQLDDQSIGSGGFKNALLKTVPLSFTAEPVELASGDTLKMKLSARRTCSGGGHNAGHVRLWYNGLPIDSGKTRDAGSHFGLIVGSADNDYFLRPNAALTVTPGSTRSFIDVRVDSKAACPDRPFTPFETWTTVLP